MFDRPLKSHADQGLLTERDRRTSLRLIALPMLLPGTIIALYFAVDWLMGGAQESLHYALWSLIAHPAMLLCYGLARRDKLALAYLVPPVWMWLGGSIMLYLLGPNLLLMFLFIGSIVFAGVLLGAPSALAVSSVCVLSYSIIGFISTGRLSPGTKVSSAFVAQSLVLGLSGTLVLLLFMFLDRQSRRRLEQDNRALEHQVTEQSVSMAANDRRMHAQFKGMPVPTFAWRRIDDNFVLADYNEAAVRQTRGGVQRFVGTKATDMYASRPDIVEDMDQCYREQSQIQREMRYAFGLTDDIRDLRVTYAYIAPDTILVHTEDITAHKAAQEALLESERRMASMLANLPGMAYRCANDEQWTMQYISDGCQALTGYAAQDLLHNRLAAYADLVHPQDLSRVHAAVDAGHNVGDSFEMTYRIITAGGQTKWVWEQGSHVLGLDGASGAIEGIIMDVTQVHQAQTALEASEARNRSLVEAFPDAIIVTDHMLNILMVNHSATRILAASSSQALHGALFYDLVAPSDRERARSNVARGVGMAPYQQVEYEMMRLDGSRFPGELSVSLVRDFEGRETANILFVRDVTERRHLQQQLQAALKLEAVGQLAGGIAHDFNNLLTVINGYAGFLVEALTADKGLQGDAIEVLRAGERAAHLTRQLLAFSRRQVMQTQITNLNDVIVDIEPMLRSLLGETIRLDLDLAPELANAHLDRAQMERAITNLVTNARDAMSAGGTLCLSTTDLSLERPLHAVPDDIMPGRYVVLSVVDDGEGMADGVRRRALEPFFTTKEVGQGTGLGLSMVYGTIKQLGGALSIESQPSAGTSVRLYLPSSHQRAVRPAFSEPPKVSLAGQETILLVEDESLVREYVARALRQLGYQVLEAKDGNEALECCRRAKNEVDLMLSDVVMPGLSGPELAEAIEKIGQNPQVLYMSGHSEDVMRHLGTPSDKVELIRKPFAPQELALRIRRLLDT